MMVMGKCRAFILGITALIGLSSEAVSAWNLPYAQPAKYNYSSSYSADFRAYLAADSSYQRTALTKGWTYYKAHFMMSNGLVNHMRGQNVGTNEAVSEGQGYGMVLALLNNDQTTFNTIFAAANSYMWDNGRKSYNWQYMNGSISAGAAADADLDIGLALVFADELRKKGYWNAYSSGGITYQSRAMEIIRTIRSKMCSNDYLLPGDNWGGDAINNLNPSYFATAWLKVFNAYQTEVNFDAVITKCYQVLKARSAQYAKGQAPDWCTSSGGQASQRPSLAMGNDAIRTPWRIAMDALWFNDSRAIEFCTNSRNTLTKYTDPSKNFVMAQMCQYDQSGNVNASTCGSFSEVAMWCSGVMGSKDTAYTRRVITPVTVGRIVGQYDCFGDKSMSDHLYYYKQSIGILGFAAIGGQFPNVLEDMRTIVGVGHGDRTGALHSNPFLRTFSARRVGSDLIVSFPLGAITSGLKVEVLTISGRMLAVCRDVGSGGKVQFTLGGSVASSALLIRVSDPINGMGYSHRLVLR